MKITNKGLAEYIIQKTKVAGSYNSAFVFLKKIAEDKTQKVNLYVRIDLKSFTSAITYWKIITPKGKDFKNQKPFVTSFPTLYTNKDTATFHTNPSLEFNLQKIKEQIEISKDFYFYNNNRYELLKARNEIKSVFNIKVETQNLFESAFKSIPVGKQKISASELNLLQSGDLERKSDRGIKFKILESQNLVRITPKDEYESVQVEKILKELKIFNKPEEKLGAYINLVESNNSLYRPPNDKRCVFNFDDYAIRDNKYVKKGDCDIFIYFPDVVTITMASNSGSFIAVQYRGKKYTLWIEKKAKSIKFSYFTYDKNNSVFKFQSYSTGSASIRGKSGENLCLYFSKNTTAGFYITDNHDDIGKDFIKLYMEPLQLYHTYVYLKSPTEYKTVINSYKPDVDITNKIDSEFTQERFPDINFSILKLQFTNPNFAPTFQNYARAIEKITKIGNHKLVKFYHQSSKIKDFYKKFSKSLKTNASYESITEADITLFSEIGVKFMDGVLDDDKKFPANPYTFAKLCKQGHIIPVSLKDKFDGTLVLTGAESKDNPNEFFIINSSIGSLNPKSTKFIEIKFDYYRNESNSVLESYKPYPNKTFYFRRQRAGEGSNIQIDSKQYGGRDEVLIDTTYEKIKKYVYYDIEKIKSSFFINKINDIRDIFDNKTLMNIKRFFIKDELSISQVTKNNFTYGLLGIIESNSTKQSGYSDDAWEKFHKFVKLYYLFLAEKLENTSVDFPKRDEPNFLKYYVDLHIPSMEFVISIKSARNLFRNDIDVLKQSVGNYKITGMDVLVNFIYSASTQYKNYLVKKYNIVTKKLACYK